jgi:DNA-binding MarR family transcriptional regulator
MGLPKLFVACGALDAVFRACHRQYERTARDTMPDQFDLTTFLPYQMAVAASRISRGFAERYQAEFGLTIPEWRVLAHLAQSGRVSVREIHARVDMDKSKVSRAAARLEAAGLIAKRAHGTDRRLLDMTLTDAGHAMMVRIVPIARTYEAQVMAELGAGAEAFRAMLAGLATKR